jgi:hypothetical protein
MSNDEFAELRKKTAAKRFGQPPTESTANMVPEQQEPLVDPALEIPVPQRIDGRSLRRTGRTIGFSTKVTEDWDYRLKTYAGRHNLLIVQVLEKALDALEREEKASKKKD